jgi:hypothetical protein
VRYRSAVQRSRYLSCPVIDRHVVAIISLAGSSFDLLGAMYLAYDLLGGEHGPLRTLTRGVTYASIFGAGYGLTLGLAFGLATGVTHGITLGWEFSCASRDIVRPGFWFEAGMSAIRGLGYGVGTTLLFGPEFGITFGILSTLGQIAAYWAGIRPSLDYAPAARPRMSKRQFLAAVNRTAGYAVAGYLSALAGNEHDKALALGLETGLIVGIVTAIGNLCTPLVEWIADTMPAQRMGVIGVALILVGFGLQSVQYWIAVLDVPVR